MNTTPFQFFFDAESDVPDAMPYVARITWNAKLKKIEHHMMPMKREAKTATLTRVSGSFEAYPMEVIETRRGLLKRPRKTVELRSWYLVVTKGCLLLIGEGHDVLAYKRIEQYLAGTISIHELGQRKWDFATVESDWRAVPDHPSIQPPPSRVDQLKNRRTQLMRELNEINHELTQLTATAREYTQ